MTFTALPGNFEQAKSEILHLRYEYRRQVISLRKQDAAIKQLRAALGEIAENATDPYSDGWAGAIAKQALAATEEFAKFPQKKHTESEVSHE